MILALLLACQGAAPPAAPTNASSKPRPDLLLVLTPGLRADAPGQRGAEGAFLEALGRVPAHRFDAAYAQSPSPFTSFGSLLTGLYVGAIPMCSLPKGASRGEELADRPWCTQIPETRYTIPDVLGLYGYHTMLLTTGYEPAKLFAGEFQVARDVPTTADLPKAAAELWGTEGPRLMVVIDGDLRFPMRADSGLVLGGLADHQIPTPEQEAAALVGYTKEAGKLGTALGEVMSTVEKGTGTHELVSIVAGLNGLQLGEQGGSRDPMIPALIEDFMLDRTIHVPLFVFEPGTRTTLIHDDPVELVDIFPTFADLADVRPPAGLPGADLRKAPVALGGGTAYAELGDQLAIRQGTNFLLFRCYVHLCTSLDPQVTERLEQAEITDLGNDKPYALYDVVWDPWQNQMSNDVLRARALRNTMLRTRHGVAAVPTDAVDAQKLWSIRMVRANGYW